MPRTKSCLAAPKGKPKGQSKPTSISRSLVVCKVDGCDMKKRNDKIQAHQRKMVLWTESGEPASEDHPDYKDLNANQKMHTDWFRKNDYTSTKFPINKRIISGGLGGPMDKFLKLDVNKNVEVEEGEVDEEDPDDPDEPPDEQYDSDADAAPVGEGLGSCAGSSNSATIQTFPATISEDEEEVTEKEANEHHSLESGCGENSEEIEVLEDMTDEETSKSIGLSSPLHSSSNTDSDDMGDGGRDAGLSNSAHTPSPPQGEDGFREELETSKGNICSLDANSVKAIADELEERFASSVEIRQLGGIAKVIARRLVEEKENVERRKETESKLGCEWIEDEENNFYICVACLRHVSSDVVPQNLRKHSKGNFGFLDKNVERNKVSTRKMRLDS